MIFVNSTEEIATNKLNKVIDKIDHIIKKYDKNAIMAGEGPCMKDLVNIADEDFRNVSIASYRNYFYHYVICFKINFTSSIVSFWN